MNRNIVLCIMDGWGISEKTFGNAVLNAKTPFLDYLYKEYPHNLLHASGNEVGLPEGQMGNSEVGHINIGAGRIVYTGLTLINKLIKEDTLKNNPIVKEIFNISNTNNSNLHFLILASNGGVHSHLEHLYYFAKLAKEKKQKYYVHLFSDGRDVAINQFKIDLQKINDILKTTGGTIVTISGRYYAMDRDENWDRTFEVFNYLTGIKNTNQFNDAIDYISDCYKNNITDEFITPAINSNSINCTIKKNDTVVFLNFRPDRTRQISSLFCGSNNIFKNKGQKKINNINFYGMMNYPGINLKNVILANEKIINSLGEILNKHNIKQLRIAETEKYPHVTFFFDGGEEKQYKDMKKILVPSPKVKTYDLKPEMSSFEITEQLLKEISNYKVTILNFACPDMVGHTGSFESAIKACEAVDNQIKKIHQKIKEINGILIIISDHGNVEMMIKENGEPHTAHTTNLVPVIICDKNVSIRNNGKISDISPTILDFLNISQPHEMTGKSLIKK